MKRSNQKNQYALEFIKKLSDLSAADKDYLYDNCHVKIYKYNSLISFINDSNKYACYLASGFVADRYYNFKKEQDQYVEFYRQGEFFYPATELLDNIHGQEELIAFSDRAIVIIIPYSILERYKELSPLFDKTLQQQNNLKLTRARLFDVYCNVSSTKECIQNTLFYLAFLYGQNYGDYVRLPRRIDQNVLASYTRSSISLVNSVINDYCKQGLAIRGRRKIMLKCSLVDEFIENTAFNMLDKI